MLYKTAKITPPKHLVKHIDFVVKRQVNVAFKISAHIITQNSFFFEKKINHDSHDKKKKGKRTQKKTNKISHPHTTSVIYKCGLQASEIDAFRYLKHRLLTERDLVTTSHAK